MTNQNPNYYIHIFWEDESRFPVRGLALEDDLLSYLLFIVEVEEVVVVEVVEIIVFISPRTEAAAARAAGTSSSDISTLTCAV